MDVVNKLRCETRDLHERLEETVLLKSLMSPELSPERYTELLIRLYRHWVVLARLEQEIRPRNTIFVTPETDCSWPQLLEKLNEEALATESPFACVQSAVAVFQWLIRGSDWNG